MNNPRLNPIFGILILVVCGVGGVLGIYYTSVHDPLPDQAASGVQRSQSQAGIPDLITYADNPQLFQVLKRQVPVSRLFTSVGLASQSQECGKNLPASHFDLVLSRFNADDKATIYEFHSLQASQDPPFWRVTVIPNRMGYVDTRQLADDFDICAAGGDLYPMQTTDSNLLFSMSCGSGYDDGSGKPHGCDIIREAVESTLALQ